MKNRFRMGVVAALLLLTIAANAAPANKAKVPGQSKRNVIIFVVDGLRPASVNPTDAPTLWALRNQGVNFPNSHSLFPTFTTPNASAIATGHYLGDTSDFSNTIYVGYPIYNTGNFGNLPGTPAPFVESDQVLGDLDDHYNGNWLDEESLLQLARENGYNTASVGKVGPVGLQDVSQLQPVGGVFVTPTTVFVDDSTGRSTGIPLSSAITTAITNAGLPTTAPDRSNGCGATDQCNNGYSGNNQNPGTTSPNTVQQQYFTDVVTKAILPTFVQTQQPFALLFWSRDADGTQHNQGDSLNKLQPGINGSTSKESVKNADNNLKQILDYINNNQDLKNNTDIFITADHGFATISKHEVDAQGHFTQSYSTQFIYKDINGRVEVNPGFLPAGFLAIDLAHALDLNLFDPDSIIKNDQQERVYEPVDPSIGQQTATERQRPANGNGLIGASGHIMNQTDAKVVIAANGGSDLVYLPQHDDALLAKVVHFLAQQDYVGALYVDDSYGAVPGTLPLSSINLVGDSLLPRPAVAVGFKTFYLPSATAAGVLLNAVQIADSTLQEGQGMHGSIARDNTFNNMAAYGPDFKQNFVDVSPVSNADLAPTLAKVLGLKLESNGQLVGRVIEEALVGGPDSVPFEKHTVISSSSDGGNSTILYYQNVNDQLYFDASCFGDMNALTVCQH